MTNRIVDVKAEETKDGSIYITANGALFSINNVAPDGQIAFWLTQDQADKLQFQISTVLQDIDRRKDK